MQDRAFKNPKISFVWDTEVAEVLGDEEVNGLRLSNLKTGEESTLPGQGLFLAIGHKPNTDLFKALEDAPNEKQREANLDGRKNGGVAEGVARTTSPTQ